MPTRYQTTKLRGMPFDPTGLPLIRLFKPAALRAEARDVEWPSSTGSGAEGPEGPQGPPGQDGAPGVDGADGIDGQDAYGVGALNTRPAANTVPVGFTWIATDDWTRAVSDGTTWLPQDLGRIRYTEKTNGPDYVVTVADGRKDIPNLQVLTFDVLPGQEMEVRLYAGKLVASNAGAWGQLYIADNAGADAAANIKGIGEGVECYTTAAGKKLGSVIVFEKIDVPGTYSRKGQSQAQGNTITFKVGTGANAIPPLTLSVTRVK